MLIVGTKGRSLGGLQGLISTNSFSKWCLQYSPIPVVVVRPTEKRMKKKKKRDEDPVRQEYARILKDSGVDQHEIEYASSTNNLFEEPGNFEKPNDPDAEAHAVAMALNLPSAYDPTLKPVNLRGSHTLTEVNSGTSDTTSASQGQESRASTDFILDNSGMLLKSPKRPIENPESPVLSGEESSDDDEEGEFDVVDGRALLGKNEDEERIEEVRKQKLHAMEVGEAAALMSKERKKSVGSLESSGSNGEPNIDEDEDSDEDGGGTPIPGDETPKNVVPTQTSRIVTKLRAA